MTIGSGAIVLTNGFRSSFREYGSTNVAYDSNLEFVDLFVCNEFHVVWLLDKDAEYRQGF